MKYKLSGHALEEIERRRIPLPLIEVILEKPDQVVPERGVVKAYQSKAGYCPNLISRIGMTSLTGICHPERSEGSRPVALIGYHNQCEILRRCRSSE